MSNDMVIKNGMVMDGSGSPAFRADVIVRDNRIFDIGLFPDAEGAEVIDAEGLVVSPGFIDVHSHLDFVFPSPRHAEILKSWVHQGVTTIVAGNCGFSPAPVNPGITQDLNTYWQFAVPDGGLDFQWQTKAEYLDFLEKSGMAYNVAILTGHNTLRLNVMGSEARFAADDEISTMKQQLQESLEAGSLGLSVGLNYWPGTYSHPDEVKEMASVLRDFDRPLVCHPRGLSYTYDSAVAEMIDVAETHSIPLHLSHHMGGLIPDMNVRTITDGLLAQAENRGLRIGFDNMPWTTGSTALMSYFPPQLMDGGSDQFFERLKDPEIRKQAIDGLKNDIPKWPTWENKYWTDKWFAPDMRVCGFQKEHNRSFEFMEMQEIADALNKDLYEAGIDLLIEEEGRLFALMGLFDHPEDDDVVNYLISDPKCSIMTDIVGADYKTRSPVAYGAFTKVLGTLARDKGFITQEEAVRRMTSLPAAQMQLKDRGLIQKGAFADITIFDPETVKNKATFENPFQLSEGIAYVIINGVPVLNKGDYAIKSRPGSVIRQS